MNNAENSKISDGISNDFVTGDTPTIYAGSVSSLEQKNEENQSSGGLFGLKLPALPNILDSIGKIGLPNLGLNINWGNLPSFGRVSEGSKAPPNKAPFDLQRKPYRGPDSSEDLWVQVGPQDSSSADPLADPNVHKILSNEQTNHNILPNRKPMFYYNYNNYTNHAKFYNNFSPSSDKNSTFDTNTELPPLAFAEPSPENDNTNNKEVDFLHPFSRFKPSPNSGTPFLPGLITNKKQPFPHIPNRNFYGNRQKDKNIPTSKVRGEIHSGPSLKFPDEDKRLDGWKWSHPNSNYTPIKASPHFPNASFRPMTVFNSNSSIVTKDAHQINNSITPSDYFDYSTSIPSSISSLNEHTKINQNVNFSPKTNQEKQKNNSNIKNSIYNKGLKTNELKSLQMPTFTSTSPYDEWTKSFVNNFDDIFSTTLQSQPETTTTQSFTSDNLNSLSETTESSLDVTEMFVPVSLLSNSLEDDNSTKLQEYNNQHTNEATTIAPIFPLTNNSSQVSITTSLPSTTLEFLENMFISDRYTTTPHPQWLYPKEQSRHSIKSDDIRNRDFVRNNWGPPSSVGQNVTLVQGSQRHQTSKPYISKSEETPIQDEHQKIKHISPSRSMSFSSGVSSVEKLNSSFSQEVQLRQHKENNKGQSQSSEHQTDLITQAPAAKAKKAGVMDWYYSNYNRKYNPEGPLPIGGNGPPPKNSSFNNKLANKWFLYTFILWLYLSY